jgi:hypothetical protein
MKTITGKIFGLVFLTAFFFGANFTSFGESFRSHAPVTNTYAALLQNPALTNSPSALATIRQVLATPPAPLAVPVMSTTNHSASGTFWTMASPVPLPGNFFPTLPVYTLDASNHIYMIDDRSVDYVALQAQQAAEAATNGTLAFEYGASDSLIDTNGLWLEIPTNTLPDANRFNVVIRHTTAGKYYDVLTKSDLLLSRWAVERTILATNSATPVTLFQNDRTNLFVWAREAVIPVVWQPVSQEVYEGDSVTFRVIAYGNNLSYQWTFNGTNIYGATASFYTIEHASLADAGDYACIITSADGSVTSEAGSLVVDSWGAGVFATAVMGMRQDYTFHRGITYLVNSTVQLVGVTTIEGGAVIKFDYTQPYPCLQVLGSLAVTAGLYDPAFLTSIDDYYVGADWGAQAEPAPVFTGAPFLDLTAAGSLALGNLHFRFADVAVSTPYHGRLDVWDSQFFQCNVAAINEFGGVNSFHNALFAGCGDAVYAVTNNFVFEAEHITADVSNVWESPSLPVRASVTNSIIWGTLGSATVRTVNSTVFNPDGTNFQGSGSGVYYLADNSSLHRSGSTNVSGKVLGELRQRTTFAPLALPAFMKVAGNLTFYPRATRYTNGPPDLGYHYDPLDYTVAWMTNFGTVTIEPGTAIGTRNEPAGNLYTWWGFDLREGSTLTSHGQPDKRNVFADAQRVQEQNTSPSIAAFLPDCQNRPPVVGPMMDFRFTDFYAGIGWYHIWSGFDEGGFYLASFSSVMNLTVQDSAFHGGKVNLGLPSDGSRAGHYLAYTNYYGTATVDWRNNLFEDVASVNIDPGYYWYDQTVNVDMAFAARNNLFRNNGEIIIAPFPATAGNWTLTDNLFDQSEFYQDPTLPLDFDYNAYWLSKHLLNGYDTAQLDPGVSTNSGLHEMVLSYAPSYAKGTFGNYYLSSATTLWQAGSRSAVAAGLSQYTIFTNQFKDTGSQPVSIGLHYIAATNSLPLDTDHDGVPDFVEMEYGTNPNLASTDGTTPDALNAAYDDVDLSGNGLVGRIKKALGLNPTNSVNPLTLKQVSLPDKYGIVSFELPIHYDLLTNIGIVNLKLNGITVNLEDFGPATNGNTLLNWNTLYDHSGLNYLQAKISLNGNGDDFAVISGDGQIGFYKSDNTVRFFECGTIFSEANAYLDAEIPVQNAEYTIRIYSPATTPPSLIKTISNSTTNGLIQEDWDLTMDGSGSAFTGSAFDADFEVSLLDAPGGSVIAHGFSQKQLAKTVTHERVNGLDGFDLIYFYTPTNNDLSSLFDHGDIWYGMQGVVDTLTQPSFGWDVYSTSFNEFRWFGNTVGYPGYITSKYTVTNKLFPSMADGTTKSFYGDGHGNYNYLGDAHGGACMWASEVANILGNHVQTNHWPKGLITTDPYRFVFLDGCKTASGKDWRRAFGIMPLWATNQAARQQLGPQAFVGWAKVTPDYFGGFYSTNRVLNFDESKAVASAYADTLQLFYEDWMNGVSLANCIRDATNTAVVYCPLPLPGRERFTVVASGVQYNVYTTNTSPIYVVGHSGLTITGLREQDDNQFVSPIDTESK